MIDLDLSGKWLTDEGFSEVTSALIEALKYRGSQGPCTRLEELSLKESGINPVSLQALTPVVRLACHDLRDLDLSGNQIRIETENDVAIWEKFLASFAPCCVMRRFDLSGNILGPKGYEVLLRVYAKESPLDLALATKLGRGGIEMQNQSTDRLGSQLRKMSLISECEENSGYPTECFLSSKGKDSKPSFYTVVYFLRWF